MVGALVSSTCGLEAFASARRAGTGWVAVVCWWSARCPSAAPGMPKMGGGLAAGRSGASLLLRCLLNRAWQWGENKAEERSGGGAGPGDVPLPHTVGAWLGNEGL